MLFPMVLFGFKSDFERTKTFTESVAVSEDTYLKIKNNCGPIEFISTTGTEARFEAHLLVEGESEEEIQKVMDRFELKVDEAGVVVDVVADDNVMNWVQYKSFFINKNTITFNDGTEAKNITNIEVSFVVYIPTINKLGIYNRYDEVKFDNFDFDVEAELFSSEFRGGDINGNLDLNLKYGDIDIGNIQDGEFMLFDCDSKVQNAKNLNLNVKYSDLEFGNVENCEMQSFDDEIKIGNISESIDVDAKYSEIDAGNFSKGDFELFDCTSNIGNGQELKLESKYSELTIGNVNSLAIEFFQDELKAGEVIDLAARNTKYSDIDIDKINESFVASSSFQDNFNIGVVASNVKTLELEGKYTDLDFPIPSDVSYFLDADLQYSTFVFPKECDTKDRENGDQAYSIDCEFGNPNDKSLIIKLDVFDGDIIIK